MTTLTINAGSSSLRLALFDKNLNELHALHLDRIKGTHEKALKSALKDMPIELSEIKKVGHRVVHGGEKFTKPTPLNKKTLREIEKL
jgi:acetate kinase